MRLQKITVATMLTIAATGIAAATAHAEPAATAAPTAELSGSQDGVNYTVSRSDDGTRVIAKLDGGTFAATDSAVQIVNRAGTVVDTISLTLPLGADTVNLRPQLDQDSTTLTATPIGQWRETSPRQRNIEMGMAMGLFAGGMIGGVIGLAIGLLGFVVLGVITLPLGGMLGALAGAAIGAGIGGTIPASDVPDRRDYVENCWDMPTGVQYCN